LIVKHKRIAMSAQRLERGLRTVLSTLCDERGHGEYVQIGGDWT